MTAGQVEAARLPIMLAELRLPTINRLWPEFAARADQEGWPAARFLGTWSERPGDGGCSVVTRWASFGAVGVIR
jgi:hypothetical protein